MPAALREWCGVDLDGAKAGTVTESEARQAKDRATEIFAQIEARKRPHVWVAPTNVVEAAPAAPALKILKADSTLNNDELLASIEKHITTLKTLMGLPDPAMQKELSRPVVLLLIDESRTLDARLTSWLSNKQKCSSGFGYLGIRGHGGTRFCTSQSSTASQ
jgi:hypothetical protein